MSDIVIRSATQDDANLLWDFLAIAGYEPSVAVARTLPVLTAYLDGWRRPTDFGLIAEQDSVAVGTAWARQFPSDGPKFYFDERTPELTIGVKEHARGQGVGELLIRALIAEATGRGLRLSLNVRDTNPARRLYERMGFRVVPGMTATNRVGGQSIAMVFIEKP
jgi:ribosomal protein S18 acetylase RimI-like enzyme